MNRLLRPPTEPIPGTPCHLRILVLLSLIAFSSPGTAQDQATNVGSASQELETGQEFEIEGRSELERGDVYVDEVFQYTLTLSWEGNQQWINLDPPDVTWPEDVQQVDVRTKSVSKVGSMGPVGEKSFIYDLSSKKSGTIRLPEIEVEILFRDSSAQTVEILGREVIVSDRPTPASEKILGTIKKNGWIIGGVSALLVGALVFVFISRKRETESEADKVDDWEPLEENLKRCEALQKAGQAREFYCQLESTLISACILCSGRSHRKMGDYCDDVSFPESLKQDLQPLSGEIEERKYRPDQPRPDEIQRTYKQARSVLSSLKQLYQQKGS